MYQINRNKVDYQKFHFILLNINKYESKDKDNYQQKQFDLFLNIYNIALVKSKLVKGNAGMETTPYNLI